LKRAWTCYMHNLKNSLGTLPKSELTTHHLFVTLA
jgi:hypothetical protein